ncbi:MAG TPA: hypothetical protein VIE47_03665 [Methylocystis sp.]
MSGRAKPQAFQWIKRATKSPAALSKAHRMAEFIEVSHCHGPIIDIASDAPVITPTAPFANDIIKIFLRR